MLGISRQQRLVAPHPRVVVDVARLGHPDDGVNQQAGLDLLGRAQGQLLVGAVHRVAGLERHHPGPPQLGEGAPQLGRGVPQLLVVVVRHRLHALDPAPDVRRPAAVEEVGDAGVLAVGGAEHRLGLRLTVRTPDVLHVEDGQHHALGVAEGQAVAGRQLVGQRFADVERDRDRPQRAVSEPHAGADGTVVARSHEPRQWGEPAVEQQLKVADLAGSEIVRGPVPRCGSDIRGPVRIGEQVGEDPAVRGDEMG